MSAVTKADKATAATWKQSNSSSKKKSRKIDDQARIVLVNEMEWTQLFAQYTYYLQQDDEPHNGNFQNESPAWQYYNDYIVNGE